MTFETQSNELQKVCGSFTQHKRPGVPASQDADVAQREKMNSSMTQLTKTGRKIIIRFWLFGENESLSAHIAQPGNYYQRGALGSETKTSPALVAVKKPRNMKCFTYRMPCCCCSFVSADIVVVVLVFVVVVAAADDDAVAEPPKKTDEANFVRRTSNKHKSYYRNGAI